MSTHPQSAELCQGLNIAAQGDCGAATDVFPLSCAQEGIWLAEKILPGTPSHNLAEAWHLKGPLQVRAVRSSLEQLIRRQEALRTGFTEKDGRPVQVVVAAQNLAVPLTDLSQRADKDSLLRRWLGTEAQRPFDLRRPPLLRVALFRLEPEEHVLFINMHHLISDAWSQDVFLHELGQLYGAAVSGSEPRLPELPIQYGDFVLWQRERLQSGELQPQIDFWREKLQEAPPPLTLPTDRPQPARRSVVGATQFSTMPNALMEDLKNLCRAERCTSFMLLLAAFKTLLHQFTRQQDMVVGAPIACRDRMETENLIGFFVNTLPLRTNWSGDPTFLQLLSRVRETLLGAHAHQEMPWEALMKTLPPQRDLSRHPLFPVVFGLQSSLLDTWQLHGLETKRLELDNGAAKFDWTLLLTERGNAWHLRSEYSTELFEPGTVMRWLHQFQVLLEEIASHPGKRLSELSPLTGAERQQLLVGWNQAATAHEPDKCVHELFERQAGNNPQAIALVCEGQTLTYAELNRRANQLARRLVACGVGPDQLVGICLDRGIEMVVSMLAILKAGGAYLPLDRVNPNERLRFMLQDMSLRVLVTDSRFRLGPELKTECVICVDLETAEPAKPGQENVPARSNPEHLAYALYTSGSTGTPKAVAIAHRGVVRLVQKPNYIDISSQDVFLQFAPASFDASTFEIWGALLNGAKLVILPAQFPSLEDLARAIEDAKVTILWLTAGLFHQMVDYHSDSFRGLRFLLAGGEALSVPHVLKALGKLGSCQLINGYGPTENTTFSCCYAVPANWRGGASVPIGRPISGTEVYILNRQLVPVPIGVPGELYLGGAGVARGYLNRPELNQDRFINNPFSTETRKLYRTGDLGRWLPDGNVEFLGRIDQQVKIRGYRVEPTEVETALLGHSDVTEALVVARAEKSGLKRLVAYVVAHPGRAVDIAALRDFLSTKLPPFLIPSHFVSVKKLPLTPQGKVDRDALPEPDTTLEEEPGCAPPRTETEKVIAAIWNELLDRKVIGIHQNLFHLGCHSLLATQAVSRMAKAFGVEVPVRTIFEYPTVAGLAEKVVAAKQDPLACTTMEREPGGVKLARLIPDTDPPIHERAEPVMQCPS